MIKWLGLLLVPAALIFAVACGDDDDDDDAAEDVEEEVGGDDDDSEAGDLVEVEGVEFAFNYDESAITADTTGFSFVNNGEQDHELVLFSVAEDVDIEAALAEETEELPEGVAEAGGTGAAAGEEGPPIEFTEPLSGRYVMLCFVPDEETGQPHYELGMISEFTVE